MPTRAELLFVENSIEKPRYIIQPNGEPSIRQGRFANHEVSINDARVHASNANLDSHGFQLVNRKSLVNDFFNTVEVSGRYYDEIRDLVSKETGAPHVHVIDHTIRSSKAVSGARGIASHAHNDYTEASCLRLLSKRESREGFEAKPNRRVIQLNVWRPLIEPVLVAPLAVVDGSSVSFEDLVACDLVYPERVGEIYELIFRQEHRWFYYPNMLQNEMLLFKGYDSAEDGRVKYTPHSAFSHPNEKPSDPARSSIEVRVIATF